MNSKMPINFASFSVFVCFSALLLISIFSSTILLLPMRSAFADSYSDGYSEGCYDAGRDLRRLNGHGYDESVHHGDPQFRAGYVNGYRMCWSSGAAGGNYYQPQPPQLQPPPQKTYPQPDSRSGNSGIRINWGEMCRNQIVDYFITEPCYTLTTPDGYTLTAEGVRVVKCLAAGTILLLYDPTGRTLAAARALGPAVGCR
jgi:hypothetical protein